MLTDSTDLDFNEYLLRLMAGEIYGGENVDLLIMLKLGQRLDKDVNTEGFRRESDDLLLHGLLTLVLHVEDYFQYHSSAFFHVIQTYGDRLVRSFDHNFGVVRILILIQADFQLNVGRRLTLRFG